MFRNLIIRSSSFTDGMPTSNWFNYFFLIENQEFTYWINE
jgi:hypothetical protein